MPANMAVDVSSSSSLAGAGGGAGDDGDADNVLDDKGEEVDVDMASERTTSEADTKTTGLLPVRAFSASLYATAIASLKASVFDASSLLAASAMPLETRNL